MARWLNWLERPVHTREVESSSLSLATKKTLENMMFFKGLIFENFVKKESKIWLNEITSIFLKFND